MGGSEAEGQSWKSHQITQAHPLIIQRVHGSPDREAFSKVTSWPRAELGSWSWAEFPLYCTWICQMVFPSPPLYLVECDPCSLAAIDQGSAMLRTRFLSWLSNHGRPRFRLRITVVLGSSSGPGAFLHFLSSCSYDSSSLPNDMSGAMPNSVLSLSINLPYEATIPKSHFSLTRKFKIVSFKSSL